MSSSFFYWVLILSLAAGLGLKLLDAARPRNALKKGANVLYVVTVLAVLCLVGAQFLG